MSVIYSKKSHRKIVHMSGRAIIKRISKKNRKSFDSLDEALMLGCSCKAKVEYYDENASEIW